MIIGGCMGLGLWYREQFRGRLIALRQMARVLELFAGEIRYGKSTLPECCGQLANHVEEPYRKCFRDIFQQMEKNDGITFAAIYRDCMQSCLQELPLSGDDRNLMLTLFSEHDFADGEMQIRSLARRSEVLEETINVLERDMREKCRLAVGMGVMSGLLLVIVLL